MCIKLVEHQPDAVPGAAEKITCTDSFQRHQRVFSHGLATQHKLHYADFWPALIGAKRGCLYSILASSLSA